MTYIAQESGAVTGKPIELFEFIYPSKTYRYTTSISKVTELGEEWTPEAITRNAIKADNRKGLAPLSIKAPKTFPPSVLFQGFTRTRISVKIYRTHIGDAEVFLVGQWFMLDVNFTDRNSVIQVGSVSLLLQTELPRFFYQFQCNHELYSNECGVAEVFLNGTVVSIDSSDTRLLSLSISIPATAQLGVITIGSERRLITTADGTNIIQILEPFEFIAVNSAFSAHDRGCDRSYNTCKTVFSNGNRFGGMPFIPKRNVFDGGF